MKHDTFDKYSADSLELPTQALLTIWDCLPDFRDMGSNGIKAVSRGSFQTWNSPSTC